VVVVTLLVLVLALAFSGRGEDDAGSQLSHAAFVAEANRICAELGRSNAGIEPPPRPYDEQGVDFFDALHENALRARERFEELQPPERDVAALERLVDAYGPLAVRLEEAAASASVEQDSEVAALVGEIGAGARRIAREERVLEICSGERSATRTIAAQVRRTSENPLTETGSLLP